MVYEQHLLHNSIVMSPKKTPEKEEPQPVFQRPQTFDLYTDLASSDPEVQSVASSVGFGHKLHVFVSNYALILMVNVAIGLAVLTIVALYKMREGATTTPTQVHFLTFVGSLYVNALHSMLVPIVCSSTITSLARLDIRFLGSIGLCTFLYFLCTTFLATMLGLVLVVTIRPGAFARRQAIFAEASEVPIEEYIDTVLDMIRSLFPSSFVESTLYYPKTIIEEDDGGQADGETDEDDSKELSAETIVNRALESGACWKASQILTYCVGTNYPGMVVINILIGITLGTLRHKYQHVIDFFSCLNDALLRLLYCMVWLSPLGIYFLVVSKMADVEEGVEVLVQMGLFVLVVSSGMGIHSLVTLPLVYTIIIHKHPFRLMKHLWDPLVTAFATSSSIATLPHTLFVMERKEHIPSVVSRFVIPLGATVNLDGSALYDAVGPIFIAQLNDVALTPMQLITISFTATLASLGMSGIPQAGLVNMTIVLRSLDLPEEDVGLILAVDWLLDRLRTTTNVLGNCFGAVLVYFMCRHEIQKENLDYVPVSEGDEGEEDDELMKLFVDKQ